MNRQATRCRSMAVTAVGLLLLMLTVTSCISLVPPTPTPTPTTTPVPTATTVPGAWRVTQEGNDLRIAFGMSPLFPQYASLDLGSGYFRLNYGPSSNFGTSVILFPALWTTPAICPPAGYCQGAKVTMHTEHEDGAAQVIEIEGSVAGLQVTAEIRLSRPSMNAISAHVAVAAQGDVQLVPKPGETYKLVMLSSMHISDAQWDAHSAYTKGEDHTYPLPVGTSDFIVRDPVQAKTFGLMGGTSSWKANAPTIEVTLDGATPPCKVLGFVTQSSDPSDENVGFWCAAEQQVRSWSYIISASSASSQA